MISIAREHHLKFVKYAVVFVSIAEARSEMFVDRDCLDRLPFHIDIPDLHGQIVTRQDVAAVMGETDIGDGGDDFGKEGTGRGIFFLFKHW